MLRSLVGSEMCIRDRVSTQSTGLTLGMMATRQLVMGAALWMLVSGTMDISPDNPMLAYTGRTQVQHAVAKLGWSGCAVSFVTNASEVHANLLDNGGDDQNHVDVMVDGHRTRRLNLSSHQHQHLVHRTSSPPPVHPYVITLFKSTETDWGEVEFRGLELSGGQLSAPPERPQRRMEFIGDSITVGYGCDGSAPCKHPNADSGSREDNYNTWAQQLSRQLGAEAHVVAWSGRGLCAGYDHRMGHDPDTAPLFYPRLFGHSTARWDFTLWVPHAVVIKLGCNDFDPTTPPRPTEGEFVVAFAEFVKNITEVYYKGHNVTVFGACGPVCPDTCETVKLAVAAAPGAHFVNQTYNYPKKDQGCEDHPNEEGHRQLAAITKPVIASVMGWS
eukprot:TRINITY_DN24779_c0_g1_i2.p1 TRINITY_DN24779_c0_g1~~TRINITY_DN24779_c0_g1_i2.p1  ORF type:complete len:420 (-),score=109.41 TRINITY_DN24779_c0_g1_i2:66-1226(-)